MPNYDELIQQSQKNVKDLSEKLKELDKLHQDIKELIKQPEIFDSKFQQIVKLSEDYTNTLGTSTRVYLDGNNILFTEKLKELSDKTKVLQKEVSRLECIDLEKHFDKHQKTLSEIFGAVNSINLILSGITQSLTGVNQSLGTIQNTNDTNHNAIKQQIAKFNGATTEQLNNQGKEAKFRFEHLEKKLESLAEQNESLKKHVKTNRIIQIIGLTIVSLVLVYIVIQSVIVK
jgi:ABC-type transporter Mla subunit MlaD